MGVCICVYVFVCVCARGAATPPIPPVRSGERSRVPAGGARPGPRRGAGSGGGGRAVPGQRGERGCPRGCVESYSCCLRTCPAAELERPPVLLAHAGSHVRGEHTTHRLKGGLPRTLCLSQEAVWERIRRQTAGGAKSGKVPTAAGLQLADGARSRGGSPRPARHRRPPGWRGESPGAGQRSVGRCLSVVSSPRSK